jgi:GT2 family glycosyltransferase
MSMTRPTTTVSIVLYETPLSQLEKCLQSLANVEPLPNVHLVDNSPTDALRAVSALYPRSAYTHLADNPGFGRAHNVALRDALAAGSRYHLVLNADIYFDEDVVSPIIEYMESHPEVGHVMPRVLNPDGSIQRLCKLVPSPRDMFLRRFGSIAGAINNQRFELHASGYNKIMFVPYLSGCFMLLRTSALIDVGLFDERFFMYPEDVDLTRRIAARYETIFFPHVSVYHEHGAASRKSLKMFAVHFFNMVRYFNKWGWLVDPGRRELNRKTLAQPQLQARLVD